MKHRVLFFIESLQCGGAEKSLISLLPLLDYSQVDVDLMLLKRGGIFEQYIPKEVRIIDFHQEAYPIWFRVCQTLFSLRLRWNNLIGRKEHGAETRWRTMHSAYRNLQQSYDVAIAYQQGFPTYYIAEKVNATKKITWVNADITKVGYNAVYNLPFYQQYNTIVPVSHQLQQILECSPVVPKQRLKTVLDILNVDLIHTMSKEPIQFWGAGNKIILVTVGRLVALKGYDMAIEAAQILKSRKIAFVWYFIGEGTERSHLEQLIAENGLRDEVILLGEQANPYPYMVAADIYVQTSRFEGFGLTLAEARILGKPVVSTNFPVVYDQIQHGENGLIAEMTPESIAENIITLMTDEALRDKIMQNVQKEVNTTAQTETAKVMRMITK